MKDEVRGKENDLFNGGLHRHAENCSTMNCSIFQNLKHLDSKLYVIIQTMVVSLGTLEDLFTSIKIMAWERSRFKYIPQQITDPRTRARWWPCGCPWRAREASQSHEYTQALQNWKFPAEFMMTSLVKRRLNDSLYKTFSRPGDKRCIPISFAHALAIEQRLIIWLPPTTRWRIFQKKISWSKYS